MTDQPILTPEGKEKLVDELNHLREVKRKEISDRIELAKEHGDLSENAEYQEARNEQSFMEGRIIEIENILKNATVAEVKTDSNSVQIGSTVTVEYNGQEMNFTIVGSNEGDPAQRLLSCDSPIGQALLERKKGDTVAIETPRGQVDYLIKKIS